MESKRPDCSVDSGCGRRLGAPAITLRILFREFESEKAFL
jgi:hypothetical protein